MKKAVLFFWIAGISLFWSVQALDSLDVWEVNTRITKLQEAVPWTVPPVDSGYDRKWYVGSILANIFTTTQKIKSDFILGFRDILWSSYQHNIPKWNGQIFKPGTLWDRGGNIWVWTSSISSWLKLDVEWKVWATEYCDENGANCFVATSFPAQWYQANNQECSNFCNSRGLSNIGDPANSNALCTSWENAFSSVSNIIYSYGIWGGYQSSSTTSVWGMCYRSGQPRDNDGTDITTWCFCSGGTQVWSNQVSGWVGGGASIWSQAWSITYLLSNNVGIGTSSPSTALHVWAVWRFDGWVQVDGNRAISNTNRSHTAQSNLSDYGFFQMKNAAWDTGAYIGAWNGWNRINFVLDAADRMNIRGWNVGIWVNDPSARLHVNGNIIARNPTANNHVATKSYVDNNLWSAGWDNLWNHTATEDLDMWNYRIINLATPTRNANAATKWYVDSRIATVPSFTPPPTCDGNNKALGWTGTSWVCNTIGSSSGSWSPTYSWSTWAWSGCTELWGGTGCMIRKWRVRTVQCVSSLWAISQESYCSWTKPATINGNACMDDDRNCGP